MCPSQTGPLPNDPGSAICDHYRLTVSGDGGPVQVRIDWDTPDNDFDLRVYFCPDPTNPAVACDVFIAGSVESGTNFENVPSFPAVGGATYEIRVQPVFLFAPPATYRGCAAFLRRATCTSEGGVINATIDPPLSISNARVVEGDSGTSQAVFAVALGWATVTPVTVNYVTKDRSGVAGSDYVPTTGTLVIPAGKTRGTITVPVVGDLADESDEVFEVDLVLPDPPAVVAKIKDGQGFATIVDDDWRRIVSGSGKVGVLSQGSLSLWVGENRSGKLNYKGASTRFYSTAITAATFTDRTTLATVDTGVQSPHPEFSDGRIAPGANCVNSTGTCVAGPAEDDNGHGTQVAGIAAAATNKRQRRRRPGLRRLDRPCEGGQRGRVGDVRRDRERDRVGRAARRARHERQHRRRRLLADALRRGHGRAQRGHARRRVGRQQRQLRAELSGGVSRSGGRGRDRLERQPGRLLWHVHGLHVELGLRVRAHQRVSRAQRRRDGLLELGFADGVERGPRFDCDDHGDRHCDERLRRRGRSVRLGAADRRDGELLAGERRRVGHVATDGDGRRGAARHVHAARHRKERLAHALDAGDAHRQPVGAARAAASGPDAAGAAGGSRAASAAAVTEALRSPLHRSATALQR
jgi:hypothetical protein